MWQVQALSFVLFVHLFFLQDRNTTQASKASERAFQRWSFGVQFGGGIERFCMIPSGYWTEAPDHYSHSFLPQYLIIFYLSYHEYLLAPNAGPMLANLAAGYLNWIVSLGEKRPRSDDA